MSLYSDATLLNCNYFVCCKNASDPVINLNIKGQNYRRQFLQVFVGGSKGSQSNLLGKLGKLRVRQQGHVAQNFVATIPESRLGSNFTFSSNELIQTTCSP